MDAWLQMDHWWFSGVPGMNGIYIRKEEKSTSKRNYLKAPTHTHKNRPLNKNSEVQFDLPIKINFEK